MSSESGDSHASAGSAWKKGAGSSSRDARSKSTGRVVKAGSRKADSARASSTAASFSLFGDGKSSNSRR